MSDKRHWGWTVSPKFLRELVGSGKINKPRKTMFKPPFEIYRNSDIADQNGHVCTAESKEFAKEIVDALNEKFARKK